MSQRHHYVAASYLEQFTDPRDLQGRRRPRVWCADGPRSRIFQASPKDVANRTDYHAVRIDGDVLYDVEEVFGEFEAAAGPALKRLREGDYTFSEADLAPLVSLAILHRHRVPAQRDRLHDFRRRSAEMAAAMLRQNPTAFRDAAMQAGADGAAAESAWEFFRDPSNYRIEVPTEKSLQDALEMMEADGDIFDRMYWGLQVSLDHQAAFVTSDLPTRVFNPDANWMVGHGLGASRVEVTFPLTPKVVLCGTWADLGRLQHVEASRVSAINERTLQGAAEAFCARRDLAEWALSRLRSDEPSTKP